MLNFEKKFEKGFTLIESLIAIVVFSLFIVVIGNAFISSASMGRRAQNLQAVINTTNYVLETMAKEIRVSEITTPDGCQINGTPNKLDIINSAGEYISYLSMPTGSSHVAVRVVGTSDYALSSNLIDFMYLGFCVSGQGNGDFKQPRVTIMATVRSKSSPQVTVNVQTTLSPRLLAD